MQKIRFLIVGLIALYGIASYIVYGLEQAISGTFAIGLITTIAIYAWKITHKPKEVKHENPN